MRKRLFLSSLFIFIAAFLFLPCLRVVARAAPVMIDDFEGSSLSGWSVLSGTDGVSLSPKQFFSGHSSLRLARSSTAVEIEKTFSAVTNRRYLLRYFDNLDAQKGFYWQLKDSPTGEYYMIGLRTAYPNSTNPATFFVRYSDDDGNPIFFDTGLKRTAGWHQLEIVITEIGSFARIDGFNTSYLGAQNGYRPFNQKLKKADELSLAATWQAQSEDFFDALSYEPIASFPGTKGALITRISNFADAYGQATDWGGQFTPAALAANVDTARTLANFTLALITLCFADPSSDYCSPILPLLEKIAASYSLAGNQWKAVNSSNSHFLYECSPHVLYPFVFSSWLLRDQIPEDKYRQFWEMITAEADWFTAHDLTVGLPSQPGNTSVETYSWTGAFLRLAGDIRQQSGWQAMGEKLITASLAEENVGEGYRLYNHGIFHPGYAFYTLDSVAQTVLSYKIFGHQIPSFWPENALRLYQNSLAPVTTFDYRYTFDFFTHGVDDWHKSPLDSALPVLTLFDYWQIGRGFNLGRYLWFAASDYQVFPEAGNLPVVYEVDGYQVLADPLKEITSELNSLAKRRLVNSTVAFLDSTTYFFLTEPSSILNPPFFVPCFTCKNSPDLFSAGDGNCDGQINSLDFVLWQKTFKEGTGASLAAQKQADFTCSGSQTEYQLNDLDRRLIFTNYGRS